MVQRSKKEFEQIEELNGRCEVVEITTGEFQGEDTRQVHMAIRPYEDDPATELLKDSKTGMVHNFIAITRETKDDNVAEGSNLDKYLIEIETVYPAAKKYNTFMEAFECLKGKPIHYVYKKLGKAYKGYEGKSYFVPQAKL